MPTYDFPQDLRDAQLALHRTRAAMEQYAKTLPWSAEPIPGRETDKQLLSGTAPPSRRAPATPTISANSSRHTEPSCWS
ncbi:hypothetical protein [Streptomyces sp. NPDC096323]|uniref:hypothetical protein n=1 Tax=Streptomyces sp. NPDC096323 TaxID=3155822 RepID=UPI00331C862C